ncbi:glycogen debranching enzyme GlgX [Salmonella enterica subsp. enterica]|nr:glycogen debranching enzyme GlgX [Salmonella enterica subsp. enterica serovar Enteritidis]
MTAVDSSLGAGLTPDGVRFAVWSSTAEKIWVCLFDTHGRETRRVPLARGLDKVFAAHVPGVGEGQRYGFRADGPFDPHKGLWFDPDKLLVDPYAVEIDQPYRYDPRLAAWRGRGADTAWLMPKSIVKDLNRNGSGTPQGIHTTPLFQPGGFIYEVQVKGFTKLHPQVPHELRGTVAALAHPSVIEHLRKLRVSAVELMPITAWMDERHLPPLGLSNAWGYNPVTFMALDPRLCPGGLDELRETVAALHTAGIGVILDVVFNHTAESDMGGPTLSFRGLDANAYYRRNRGKLVNDAGTGNTIACDHPVVERMVLDALRHFIRHAGVDGFRFDLAPVLGRSKKGFDTNAPLLAAMREDPVIRDRVLIAEPWDIGTNGYQLGAFGSPWLEWNDKARDDTRKFWRGDAGMTGALATRLAGSSDVFARDGQASTRSVNYIAAHDGFALADIVAYEKKHNQVNGEKNRDGHNDNLSWNNGAEGATRNADIQAARKRDMRALLATLFASRGAIMLTAGDEFGRTQQGNNNAYAQDNMMSWLDWQGRDRDLEDYVSRLAAARFGSRDSGPSASPLSQVAFLSGQLDGSDLPDVAWLAETGQAMTESAWSDGGRRRLTMLLGPHDAEAGRFAVLVNGDAQAIAFTLPARNGFVWRRVDLTNEPPSVAEAFLVEGRSVGYVEELRDAAG